MTVIIPDKAELRLRILEHLHARPDSPLVAAVWQGYLAGLSEWGVLELHDHAELVKLLPNYANNEVNEVTLGHNYLNDIPGFREDLLEDEAAGGAAAVPKQAAQLPS